MKSKRIKWKNIILMFIFIISCFVLIHDYFVIVTSLAQFTALGVITNLLALTLVGTIGEYLYEEMQ